MEENQKVQRPQLLTILCILTFIAAGLSIAGALCIPALSGVMVGFMKAAPNYDAQRDADAITIVQAGWGYYMVMLALEAMELTGAIMMWKLKKNGFHVYTIASILLFYLPVLWLHLPFNLFGAMLSAGFVGLYAVNMRFMK